jgi:hypothetical protein
MLYAYLENKAICGKIRKIKDLQLFLANKCDFGEKKDEF